MGRKTITLNLADYVDVMMVQERKSYHYNTESEIKEGVKPVEYSTTKKEILIWPQFVRRGSVMKWLNSVNEVFE